MMNIIIGEGYHIGGHNYNHDGDYDDDIHNRHTLGTSPCLATTLMIISYCPPSLTGLCKR